MEQRGTNREGTEELKGTSGGGAEEPSVLGRRQEREAGGTISDKGELKRGRTSRDAGDLGLDGTSRDAVDLELGRTLQPIPSYSMSTPTGTDDVAAHIPDQIFGWAQAPGR